MWPSLADVNTRARRLVSAWLKQQKREEQKQAQLQKVRFDSGLFQRIFVASFSLELHHNLCTGSGDTHKFISTVVYHIALNFCRSLFREFREFSTVCKITLKKIFGT